MSEDEPSVDLDANALAMLAAYRRSERLPAEVESRVWDRVESETAATVKPSSTRWGVVALLAAAAIALLAVGIRSFDAEEMEPAAAGSMAVDRGAASETHGVVSEGRVEKEARPRSANGSARDTAELQGADEAPVAAPEVLEDSASSLTAPDPGSKLDPKPLRRPKPRPKPEATPEVEPSSSLAQETALLRRAQAAMRKGQPKTALSLLAECQRAFPGGLLREERDALEVLALCGAGKTTKGKAAAAKFLRARPGSALADRVRGACGDEN